MARRVGVVVTVLAFVGACSTTRMLDANATEARIRDRLADSIDVDVSSVSCPESVEVEAGRTFRCTARIDGADRGLPVDVRQTDDDGSLDVEPTRVVVIADEVEADIARELDDRFERDEVTVTCSGADVRLATPRARFECTAVDGSERKRVVVRVRDRSGTLTYALD